MIKYILYYSAYHFSTIRWLKKPSICGFDYISHRADGYAYQNEKHKKKAHYNSGACDKFAMFAMFANRNSNAAQANMKQDII